MQLTTPVKPPPPRVRPDLRPPRTGAASPPRSADPAPAPPATPVDPEQTLAAELYAALAATLDTPFLDAAPLDHRVRAYAADTERLTLAAQDAAAFLRQVVEQHLAGTADPAVRAERAAELVSQVPPIRGPRNVLHADLLAKPAGAVERELTAAVRVAAAELVAAVLAAVHALAARQVCGVIDWPRADVCRFTFFEEVLARRVSKSQRRKRKTAEGRATRTGRLVIGVDTVTTVETTATDRRFTRHEHHLLDATAAPPGATRWPVPDRVRTLVASAPAWVRPALRVVEGTVVVERTIARESTQSATRVVGERDVPVYAPDPALVLGPFVLAGWGEAEMRAAGPDGTSRRAAVLRGVGVVGAATLGLVAWRLTACAAANESPVLGLLALTAAVSAGCFVRCARRPDHPLPVPSPKGGAA